MSRPDAHPHEFDRVPFAVRGHADHLPDVSRDYRPLHPEPGRRDSFSARAPAELVPQPYFPPPSFGVADRRSSVSASPLGGPGYAPPFVAPRMYQQAAPVGASDSWATRPAASSVTPNMNKHTADAASLVAQVQPPPPFLSNHHHAPPRAPSVAEHYHPAFAPSTPTFSDTRDSREFYFSSRHLHQQQSSSPTAPNAHHAHPPALPSPTTVTASNRSTLWWGELEPWMDEEYVKQVCGLMGWDPVSVKVPRPAPDPVTGQQANNPGYCFLTFPSQTHAAQVLSQVNGNGTSAIMPNSSKPFALNWASSVPSAPLSTVLPGQALTLPNGQNPQYPKEYSIFVGDLAPEVSNSDLVAVFRNPVLGLRNDREPRFIRPFLSCKSAKIMLDPVTGVSRGYGFVRFTDEADQQRALIEMHGLYCLSRPSTYIALLPVILRGWISFLTAVRISPATAKFKLAPGMAGVDFSQLPFPLVPPPASALPDQQNQVTVALPLPNVNQTKSVSAPLAGTVAANSNTVSNSSSSSSITAPTLSSGSSTTSSSSTLASATSEEALKSLQYSGGTTPTPPVPANNGAAISVTTPFAQSTPDQTMAQRFNIPEESWKHHAQARAILSNLIGPNGEQLTSSDPYNTTVFVGGLSPLISEETLRTFFAPFGDIHYVKVPVGKHCGFVQFVRKPDAERAIERMQGFPIGGSRIRLSWGRSQYKAAQAAAQQAQNAAFQAQYQAQLAAAQGATNVLTAEQAMQLLEKFGIITNSNMAANEEALNSFKTPTYGSRPGSTTASTFSPFSPDPNYMSEGMRSQDPNNMQAHALPNVSQGYGTWYNPAQDEKLTNGKISPTALQAIRHSSAAQRFNSFVGGTASAGSQYEPSRSSSRQDTAITRPDISRKGSQYTTHEQDHDAIQDLNGTLASLDLNNSPALWRNMDNSHALPASP
ncbi:hypothetical protein WOLCODRAFT_162522 [Wolfiporia cocos MD-104 SS10]|uniref:RRM domain-containing protein n=1 Tax=Wolfiporia cocos (strain MD-104) TaxID=742152 RepID=A0A2H3JGU3_WOLCO|nr:hypothetical protein WOLCODRAFT_162522 [Wolfiporia cocos MD-104 SS10]